jgi:hypothetical protein
MVEFPMTKTPQPPVVRYSGDMGEQGEPGYSGRFKAGPDAHSTDGRFPEEASEGGENGDSRGYKAPVGRTVTGKIRSK